MYVEMYVSATVKAGRMSESKPLFPLVGRRFISMATSHMRRSPIQYAGIAVVIKTKRRTALSISVFL